MPDLRSPQLEPNAIQHLCSTCKISTVFADARNYDTIKRLKDHVLGINVSNIFHSLKANAGLMSDPSSTLPKATCQPDDVAFMFHTSGTSSGLPKPIPQTHHAAVGVLPRLPGGGDHPSFSTTPLYHGGIADCLRAWTSGSMVHLFPGTQPITTANVHRAVARANAHLQNACPVRYFTCVPYILQMLVAEASTPSEGVSGLKLLQQMDLVGVGGAALPVSVGDELVSNDVRLVSRYGSAECGFLLSSHRDYVQDHGWSYLRADPALQPGYYDFEAQPRSEGDAGLQLFELVVKPEWPHRGKTNRPDGSFATSDLFERHPSVPNAWRYHSRADAQITLLNGKKFDPAPVEGELLSSAAGRRSLGEAMIFGTGREAPGLLLVPRWSGSFVSNEDVIGDVWPTIEKMNGETQNHARIGRGAIVVVRNTTGTAAALPKSSKGTILRGQTERLFASEIEAVYSGDSVAGLAQTNVPDSQVLDQLTTLFEDVLGRPVSPTRDLFAQGVDSIACSQLRKSISKTFFAESDVTIPLNIIYDQGTINQLSSYVIRCRNSEAAVVSAGANDDDASEQQLMLDLAEKYRHAIHSPTGSFDLSKERIVVLTGATGFLGTHILNRLLQDPVVSKIFCLVRATDPTDAAQRVSEALKSRGLSSSALPEGRQDPRLICLPCSLAAPKLGLSEADWDQLASQATIFIHAAWSVNFSLKLRSFEDQLAGVRNLLGLRDATRGSAARFVFISSTAAVAASGLGARAILETLSSEPEDSSPLGYSQSKWVAESICTSARVGGSFSTPAATSDPTVREEEKSPIVIVRVGQLCGDEHGVWNATEAWPILLSSAKLTGCLPDFPDEVLGWLPVDLAARAVLELSLASLGQDSTARAGKHHKTPVFHVLNTHQDPSWSDMCRWVGKESGTQNNGHGIEIVHPDSWLRTLERVLEDHEHPARSLLHLWKEMLQGRDHEPERPVFDMRRAEHISGTLRAITPLGQGDVVRMWNWIQANM